MQGGVHRPAGFAHRQNPARQRSNRPGCNLQVCLLLWHGYISIRWCRGQGLCRSKLQGCRSYSKKAVLPHDGLAQMQIASLRAISRSSILFSLCSFVYSNPSSNRMPQRPNHLPPSGEKSETPVSHNRRQHSNSMLLQLMLGSPALHIKARNHDHAVLDEVVEHGCLRT